MDQQKFVYVTYIATKKEKLWEALTGEAFTQQYWGGRRIQSDWQVGSPVQHVKEDGESECKGEVLQSEPPHRLSYTFESPGFNEERPSCVLFELEQNGSTVKLTLTHDRLDAQAYMSISRGWSAILSSLKSLLETGDVLALAACK
ncbi:ATPase [Hassallia byssoidea VB512170]|uniref:ATPase n=1 Tax=Hassallia byssoidea VB512170 TaxID=1304833 RepID=A0A846HDT6_9CYAN|nr:SRPBCC family protein [Hassalia byssoidea]NEU75223.1 ATPase [Hassalia byssoidea VB512170]